MKLSTTLHTAMAKTVPVLLCFIFFFVAFCFCSTLDIRFIWWFFSLFCCLFVHISQCKVCSVKMLLFWKGRSVEEDGRKKEMHGDKKEKRKRWESEWSDKISVNWDVHGGLRGQYLQHPQPRNWTQPEHIAFNSKQIRKIKKGYL